MNSRYNQYEEHYVRALLKEKTVYDRHLCIALYKEKRFDGQRVVCAEKILTSKKHAQIQEMENV
jgi:hypothetical protein